MVEAMVDFHLEHLQPMGRYYGYFLENGSEVSTLQGRRLHRLVEWSLVQEHGVERETPSNTHCVPIIV